MTWTEYANLIEDLDTNPANWKSAAEGNPNNPFDALTLAIRESTINDVTRLIKVLLLSVDEIPAQPVATFIMSLVAQLPETPDDDDTPTETSAQAEEIAPVTEAPKAKLSQAQQAIVDAMRDGGIFTEHFGRTVVHSYGDQVTRIDVTKPTFKLLLNKGVIQDTGRRTKLGWNIYELTPDYQSKER